MALIIVGVALAIIVLALLLRSRRQVSNRPPGETGRLIGSENFGGKKVRYYGNGEIRAYSSSGHVEEVTVSQADIQKTRQSVRGTGDVWKQL